jgi:FMN-dependent NADH-azoreductase
MEFDIQFLSFYVVQVEGKGDQADKRYKHFQTINAEEYEDSPLKVFLDGEFAKIVKRKVERHPKAEEVPTKLGYFIVEEGHELTSNPNYNQFHRVRIAESKEAFQAESEKFVISYVDTSAVRGGVFLVARAKLSKYFNEPFVFILKCDFEPKVASISDESTLIRNVEMAITTKNMKSIQYPYMPEEGIMDERELKINQASHARYFEDFLKYVEYGQSMPQIVKSQVMEMVMGHVEEAFAPESEEREKMETAMEVWSTSEKREMMEQFSHEQVVEAAAQIVEQTPELELKMKLDHVSVKGLLSDFGDTIHIAKVNDKYVLMVEANSVIFEKGFSPIEFLKPDPIDTVIDRIKLKNM